MGTQQLSNVGGVDKNIVIRDKYLTIGLITAGVR